MTSVTIPNSVTSIGYSAFAGCISLTSINVSENNLIYKSINGNLYSKDGKTLIQYATGKTSTASDISNSVTSIGNSAFEYCSSLTSIELPDSVTSIGSSAFYRCDNLKTVTFSSNSQLESIGNYAFAFCSSLTRIEIPDSVTSIGDGAFEFCRALESVVIGNSLKSIGCRVFERCSLLTNIIIPDGVTSIGEYAFSGCSLLVGISIPNSVTSIGVNAFYGCSSLAYNIKEGLKYLGNSNNPYLYLADTVSEDIITAKIDSNCRFIGDSAFRLCFSFESIVVPNSVTSIGYGAFAYCHSIKIFCEAVEKPSGWDSDWNIGGRPVYWAGEWSIVDGVPTPN